jgi:DnaK suppressor protein
MRTRPSHLSEAALARLRRKLEDLRSSLLSQRIRLYDQQATEPEIGDPADLAERTIEQETMLRRVTFDSRLLAEVEHALEKLDAGTYGLSEESGAPIELKRLEVIPWARRTAAEEEELQQLLGRPHAHR